MAENDHHPENKLQAHASEAPSRSARFNGYSDPEAPPAPIFAPNSVENSNGSRIVGHTVDPVTHASDPVIARTGFKVNGLQQEETSPSAALPAEDGIAKRPNKNPNLPAAELPSGFTWSYNSNTRRGTVSYGTPSQQVSGDEPVLHSFAEAITHWGAQQRPDGSYENAGDALRSWNERTHAFNLNQSASLQPPASPPLSPDASALSAAGATESPALSPLQQQLRNAMQPPSDNTLRRKGDEPGQAAGQDGMTERSDFSAHFTPAQRSAVEVAGAKADREANGADLPVMERISRSLQAHPLPACVTGGESCESHGRPSDGISVARLAKGGPTPG